MRQSLEDFSNRELEEVGVDYRMPGSKRKYRSYTKMTNDEVQALAWLKAWQKNEREEAERVLAHETGAE